MVRFSCRRRPASIFARATRPKKTWIPAYAGMTKREIRPLLVKFTRAWRKAEGPSVAEIKFGINVNAASHAAIDRRGCRLGRGRGIRLRDWAGAFSRLPRR